MADWKDIHCEVTVAGIQQRLEQSPVSLFQIGGILDWAQEAYLTASGEQSVWMVVVDIEDYQMVMEAYVQVSNKTKGEWDLEVRSSVLGRVEIGMVPRLLSLLDSWASEEAVDIPRTHVEVMDQPLRFEELSWYWGYIMLRGWKAMTADEGLGLLYRLKPSAHQVDWAVREISALTKGVPTGEPNCFESMEEADGWDTLRLGSLRTGS